ncbi:uncharacterized protein TNCV_3080811 [Trichonephila clavipes]|nr:uncharacterized protein TNCV_3080811 [Trichonephila clavipes]
MRSRGLATVDIEKVYSGQSRAHCHLRALKHVAWSDASRFQLNRADGRVRVWRQSHESMDLTCQQGTVQTGEGCVMVRGVCSRCDMGPHVRLHTTLAGDRSQSHRAGMGFSRPRLAARTLPPVTIRELQLTLQDEWAAMPQQLIDTLILSMGRRCETCLAVRGDHIPY